MSIDRNAWLAAVNEVAPVVSDDGALTVKELSEIFGRSESRTRIIVNKLVKAGLAMQSQKAVQKANGHVQLAPAYRLKDLPTKKKGKAA